LLRSELKTMKELAVWAVWALLLGCGGKYEEPGSGTGTSDPAPSSAGSSAAEGKAGASSGTASPLPSHDLGECKPGFERATNPTRACNWLLDSGMCFDTNDAACACVCPTDHDSVCWSPFYEGAGSATPVHCD
jgi:hypothetical protein